MPGWLRDVLNGLRPVPRGIAKALLGDPDGVAALKQAFADPATRGEILSTLAVIGRGGAGEDEILADALADRSPEIRRRAVQIAARIDRRQAEGKGDIRTAAGAHAALLRGALADASADVRAAVLQEAATPAGRGGSRDRDAGAAGRRSGAAAPGRGGDRHAGRAGARAGAGGVARGLAEPGRRPRGDQR